MMIKVVLLTEIYAAQNNAFVAHEDGQTHHSDNGATVLEQPSYVVAGRKRSQRLHIADTRFHFALVACDHRRRVTHKEVLFDAAVEIENQLPRAQGPYVRHKFYGLRVGFRSAFEKW